MTLSVPRGPEPRASHHRRARRHRVRPGGLRVRRRSRDRQRGQQRRRAASYGEISVQLSWIKNEEFSGEFFADSKGYYADAGFSAVTLIAGPATGAAELLRGTADVALSDAVSVGTAIAKQEAPLKIIGATFQKNPFTILSLADGGNIATPAGPGRQEDRRAGLEHLAVRGAPRRQRDRPERTSRSCRSSTTPPLMNGEVDGFIAYLTNESITVGTPGYEVTNLAVRRQRRCPFVAETFTVTDQTSPRTATSSRRSSSPRSRAGPTRSRSRRGPRGSPSRTTTTSAEDTTSTLGDLDPGRPTRLEAEQLAGLDDDTVANGLFTITDELQEQTSPRSPPPAGRSRSRTSSTPRSSTRSTRRTPSSRTTCPMRH